MIRKDTIIQRQKHLGRIDALGLANRAADMTPTEIIEEETKVPMFNWGTDYSKCPVGSPVAQLVDGEVQIFTMITPVNTSNYPGITPATERSLYSLCHTKNPKKAKAWVAPLGISGLYAIDECCVDAGHVWQSTKDGNEFSPTAYPPYWTDLGTVEEVM